jgi:hypothetical protein
MRNSISQFKQFLRVALLALPVLLLLGLNGRTVNLLRPVESPTQSWISAPPAMVLGWLPDAFPTTWLPRLVRRAVAVAPLLPASTFVALLCRQRLLSAALSPQAP